jgi:quercetin dioxygenase-like cupin family protein
MMAIESTEEYALIPAGAVKAAAYGWGTLSFLCDANAGESPHVSMARVTLQSGKRNILHTHPNCDELLYLLHGTIRHRCGEKWVTMRAGDTLRVSKGVVHQAEVLSSDDADMIVVYSTGQRETVVLEEGSK